MSSQSPAYDYHLPVLYKETLEGLNIRPGGIYVDCTFGGGGHSRGILEKLGPDGRLIAFDQDSDAQANIPKDDRILFIAQNFRYLQRFLRLNEIEAVDGVLADLGVSSHQFDQGERGFSIRFDGPLDMRMDRRASLTAQQLLEQYSEQELLRIFSNYGEVSNSKTLAKFIVTNRTAGHLKTVQAFKEFIHPMVKGNPNKYFAQVFQALRIQVNEELLALQELLEQIPGVLAKGGRAAIITFHSLEDRMVKNFFKNGRLEVEEEHPFLNSTFRSPLKVITRKPVTARPEELRANNRSRSAKLRVAEKIALSQE
ncbi:16S rRNA (cytosine1402-N4)-methyltransferase [Arachidicoccus rhizosphaerae]|jgi:16S rRNA (cytosine1402-N4)-methyltransferase|uniref:Ribosomal RNA small subunit methyltransferase H n=1 Tax=Arachidicoccus rhizosphaerae TaxID=551991 RepID=A0A1H3Y056_9BACT|nr:16S rRNA (cytosine(1402)-N(4))-methyltransferase RsmH [Arachidicoccus rhizosphaerae]SEA05079.1 16S rRNA (cytosine1402-N4)-methyltransferase [Arachidicoccus rhizosphaerae]